MKLEYLVKGEEQLKFATELTFEDVDKELRDIPNKDIKILSLSIKGENEVSAKTLSKYHDEILVKLPLTILSNESSQYFVKALFPAVNDFEYKLRKMLFLESSLSLTNAKDLTFIEKLEEQTLNAIFEFLFTDENFNENVRKKIGDKETGSKPRRFSKRQYAEMIATVEEKTIWNQLIGKRVPVLNDKYLELQYARNDVAHAHNINSDIFNKHRNLFRIANQQLDSEINRFENPLTPVTELKDFNEIIGNALIRFIDTTRINDSAFEEIRILNENIGNSPIVKTLALIAASTKAVDLTGITNGLREVGERASSITSAIDISGVKNILSGIVYDTPPESIEGITNVVKLAGESMNPDSLTVKLEDNEQAEGPLDSEDDLNESKE